MKTRPRKPNGDTGDLVGETKKETYSLPKGIYKKGWFTVILSCFCHFGAWVDNRYSVTLKNPSKDRL